MIDASVHDAAKNVKMPPVKITAFSGDIIQWTEFKATCRSILTEKFSDVQRLHYLKDALVDEPRELVSHILPADGAYDRAMLLLKNRYENVRAIVNHHLHRLYTIGLEKPSTESTKLLRKIINTINSLTAALQGLDIDTKTWDAILIYNTSQCLHPDSIRSVGRAIGGQTCDSIIGNIRRFSRNTNFDRRQHGSIWYCCGAVKTCAKAIQFPQT